MAKKIAKVVKLQLPAGGAKPGSALASAGVNMPKFCTEFNEKTRDRAGEPVPVIITAYEDKSFDFVVKKAPATYYIKKETGLKSGSANPLKNKVAKLTKDQLKKIAEDKMEDLNANDIEAAMKIIAGSARSMGVTVED